MTATPPADKHYRGAILRPYMRGGFVVIVRPGLALHHMTVPWKVAVQLIDWSLDTGNNPAKLPAPYKRVPMPEDAAPAPAPTPPDPPAPTVAPRSVNPPARAKRVRHQRDATGRLAF